MSMGRIMKAENVNSQAQKVSTLTQRGTCLSEYCQTIQATIKAKMEASMMQIKSSIKLIQLQMSYSAQLMGDQLSQLNLMLRTEADILKICLQATQVNPILQREQMKDLIEKTILKIQEESSEIQSLFKDLKSNPLAGENEKEKYDLIKIKASKLLIQNERIFNCNQQFKEIVQKVPRIYNQDQPIMQNIETIELNVPSRKQADRFQDQHFTLGHTHRVQGSYQTDENSSTNINKIQKTNQSSIRFGKVEEATPDYNVIKSKMADIKSDLQDLHEKLDTHKHTEYEAQLNKIQQENTLILAECNLLKADNTDLLHVCHDMKRKLQVTQDENGKLEAEITQMKELITRLLHVRQSEMPNQSRPQTMSTFRRDWFLLPQTQTSNMNESQLMSSWVKNRIKD